MRRMLARQTLDALPDFPIGASNVSFKQSFVEFESEETPFAAPKTLVDACRSILAHDINAAVVGAVHDNVTVQIGCKHVHPFALVNGGRDHTIFPSDAFTTIAPLFWISENCLSRKLKWVIV